MPDTYYSIGSSTLTGIANAVRQKTGGSAQMTPEQIRQAILGIQGGGGSGLNIRVSNHLDENDNWVRPSEYPNLDAITIGNDEQVLYLTYDLRKTPGYGWIGIGIQRTTSGGVATIDRGHLVNNAFVVDETFTAGTTGNVYFRHSLDSTNGDIQLWRVTSETNIKNIGFIPSNDSSTATNNIQNNFQPCVERRGRLPYLTTFNGMNNFSNSKQAIGETTIWLERCSLILPSTTNMVATGLYQAFSMASSLQSLDMSHWDTTNWAINTLQRTFNGCRSLPKLDVSGWDTSNWAVTSLNYCFANCYSLKEIKGFSDLDASNWAITNMDNCWVACYNLKSLDLSKFDTSNWSLTQLYYCWKDCYSLETLDISTWDTSEWAIKSLSYCWSFCLSLKELDISGWDTSNWAVTNISSMFNYCFNLETLDLSSWDASGWALTNTSSAFSYLYSLRTLKLPLNITFPSTANNIPNGSNLLQNVNRYPLAKTHNIGDLIALTPTSLVNILDSLPTVTGETITISSNNRLKLTAEQIAIATQKGWTVA